MVSFFFLYMMNHTQLINLTLTYCLSVFPLAVLLMGWASLTFVYSMTTAWDRVHAILGYVVFCLGLDSAVIFLKIHAAGEYCPDGTVDKTFSWNVLLS